MRALILALLLVAAPAYADEWTATDTVAQGAVLTTLAADYWQTTRIIRDPVQPGHREANPVMREHRGGLGLSPEIYFAGVAALHTGAAYVLPQPWRRIAQVALVVVQVDSVAHNWRAGYSVTF